jgi:hypothetical protein
VNGKNNNTLCNVAREGIFIHLLSNFDEEKTRNEKGFLNNCGWASGR